MEINIKITCTPEEARKLMGLPDPEQMRDAFSQAIVAAVKDAPVATWINAFIPKGWPDRDDKSQ